MKGPRVQGSQGSSERLKQTMNRDGVRGAGMCGMGFLESLNPRPLEPSFLGISND